MIEGRGAPSHHGVAGSAIGCFFATPELTAVNVFMTTSTLACSVMENNSSWTIADRGPMTFQASHRAMSAQQREFRRGMIECRCLLPGAHVMAKLAALFGTARRIALVRVRMAVNARQRVKVIARRRRRIAACW